MDSEWIRGTGILWAKNPAVTGRESQVLTMRIYLSKTLLTMVLTFHVFLRTGEMAMA